MVQKIFNIESSNRSKSGYDIISDSTGIRLDLPTACYAMLNEGKQLPADDMIKRISTLKIALAGVTNSLNKVDGEEFHYQHNSVLTSFGLKKNGTIDDTITDYLSSVKDYEKFHTIYMDRDIPGDDSSIHAYIHTPNDGILKCIFDKSIRLYARRNNITYWIDDYKIESGSNGSKFVRPIGNPSEII